jgi:hypothetical protein
MHLQRIYSDSGLLHLAALKSLSVPLFDVLSVSLESYERWPTYDEKAKPTELANDMILALIKCPNNNNNNERERKSRLDALNKPCLISCGEAGIEHCLTSSTIAVRSTKIWQGQSGFSI